MKKLFLLSLVAVLTFGVAKAQDAQPENVSGAKISFTEMEHNYGTIQKGGDGACEFKFTNTGNEPLILSNVKASCGCTVPIWPKEPVMPGKSQTIQVKDNTNNVGGFNKTITVTSNAVDNPRLVLKIKGTVEAPANPVEEKK